MGRYKQESVIMRCLAELDIVILDKQTIWILPKRASTNIIFQRWFSPPLGSWEDWRRFKQKLYSNKSVTLERVFYWAKMHGVQCVGTMRKPNLEGRKIIKK